MSGPSTEEKLKMVASQSSSDGTSNTNNSSAVTVSSADDSEGMATAVTPVMNNKTCPTKDVSESFPSGQEIDEKTSFDETITTSPDSFDTTTDEEEEEKSNSPAAQVEPKNESQDNEEEEEEEKATEESNLPNTSTATSTVSNMANPDDAEQVDGAATTIDVTYSFPTDHDECEKFDSDINSHHTAPSASTLMGGDLIESSVGSTTERPIFVLPTSTASPSKPVLEMELSSMEATPPSTPSAIVKKDKGTPETSHTTSSADSISSYTDEDSSSSNFSTSDEEDDDDSHVTLEDSFEQENPPILPKGIVQMFMQTKQDRQRHKLRRRKQLELSREQLHQDSDDEPQVRRRPPPPSRTTRRRSRGDAGARGSNRRNVNKTLNYNREEEHVVHENRKARKAPLNDDYMLQEEVWLNMFCNAIPPYVVDYLKAFGCVQVQKPEDVEQQQSSTRHNCNTQVFAACGVHLHQQQQSRKHSKSRQPFVTDEEYIQSQNRHMQEESRRRVRNRMKKEASVPENLAHFQAEPVSDYGMSFDENSQPGTSVSSFTGLFDEEEQNLPEVEELHKPTMIDNRNLSTILEEGESSQLNQSLDVSVDYPPNQPPTFAC